MSKVHSIYQATWKDFYSNTELHLKAFPQDLVPEAEEGALIRWMAAFLVGKFLELSYVI
jgi:hypothetical protein